MTTTRTPALAALHDADSAMRTAWTAFADALAARTAAASALGARAGKISVGQSWPEYALLAHLGREIDALPTGEDLDVLVGRAALARQAQAVADEREARERAEQQERFDAAVEAIVAKMNRPNREDETARARALAAVEGLA